MFLPNAVITTVLVSNSVVCCLKFCDSPNSSLLRVIGGSTAAPGSYPWQAAIVFYDGSYEGLMCGATVVDEYWILTAAHCIMKNWKKAYILTGLNSLTDPAHTVHVKGAVIHPHYDEDEITNDIALVQSEYSLLKPGTSTVCLVKDDLEVLSAANSAMVVGFGLHIVSQTLSALTMGVSDVLLQAKLPIIPLQQCSVQRPYSLHQILAQYSAVPQAAGRRVLAVLAALLPVTAKQYAEHWEMNDLPFPFMREWSTLSGGSMTVSDKQICAGSKLHGTAPGDSGGPLLVKDALGRLVQVGITSYGAAGFQGLLDQSTYPGVYTRVSPYIPWMEEVTSSATASSLALAVALVFFIH